MQTKLSDHVSENQFHNIVCNELSSQLWFFSCKIEDAYAFYSAFSYTVGPGTGRPECHSSTRTPERGLPFPPTRSHQPEKPISWPRHWSKQQVLRADIAPHCKGEIWSSSQPPCLGWELLGKHQAPSQLEAPAVWEVIWAVLFLRCPTLPYTLLLSALNCSSMLNTKSANTSKQEKGGHWVWAGWEGRQDPQGDGTTAPPLRGGSWEPNFNMLCPTPPLPTLPFQLQALLSLCSPPKLKGK